MGKITPSRKGSRTQRSRNRAGATGASIYFSDRQRHTRTIDADWSYDSPVGYGTAMAVSGPRQAYVSDRKVALQRPFRRLDRPIPRPNRSICRATQYVTAGLDPKAVRSLDPRHPLPRPNHPLRVPLGWLGRGSGWLGTTHWLRGWAGKRAGDGLLSQTPSTRIPSAISAASATCRPHCGPIGLYRFPPPGLTLEAAGLISLSNTLAIARFARRFRALLYRDPIKHNV